MKKEDYLKYGKIVLTKVKYLFVSAVVIGTLMFANVDKSIYTSLLAVGACYIAFYSGQPKHKTIALGATAATISAYIYFASIADPTGYGGAVMMLYMSIDIVLILLGYPVCKLFKYIFHR